MDPIEPVKPSIHDIEYLRVAKRILDHGKPRDDRTGTGTIGLFGETMRFDISTSIPLLTTKFVAWKTVLRELLWMCRGETDAKILAEQGIHIWDGNTSRAFLDRRGLGDLPEGDIGAGYGFQWRHSGATYRTCNDSYEGEGVDQLLAIETSLKNDPMSRRHFMTAWNPAALERMALPPCHLSVQFHVEKDEATGVQHLSALMTQRSQDCLLGAPYNIASYAMLVYILAKRCDMVPKELIVSIGDAHIYKDHVEGIREQLTRAPYGAPRFIVKDRVKNKTWATIGLEDFEVEGYRYYPSIKAKMSV